MISKGSTRRRPMVLSGVTATGIVLGVVSAPASAQWTTFNDLLTGKVDLHNTNNGHVGIGPGPTGNGFLGWPLRKLDVNGTIRSTGSDFPWTSNSWGRGLELFQGNALLWGYDPRVISNGGVYRGIGTSGGGNFYVMRSTVNDTSQPATYDLFIDTAGKLGIATTAPTATLDVNGKARMRGDLLIDSAGKLGIGTATPGRPLEMRLTQSIFNMTTTSNVNGSVIELRNNTPGSTDLGAFNFTNAAGSVVGQLAYKTANAFSFALGGAERLRIAGNGNVGINVATPASRLTVYEAGDSTALSTFTQAVGSAGVNIVTDYQNAAYTPGIFWSTQNDNPTKPKAGIFLFESSAGTWMNFGTSNSYATGITNTALTISPAGNVGIGTPNPTHKLEVAGRTKTQVLEITGGSDFSEQFDVNAVETERRGSDTSELAGGSRIDPEPGMVVCVDAASPGELVVSTKPFDRTVAGIISGAGGVNTGLLMSQTGSLADGQYPVALTGRVWVKCDASDGAIQPGDLLTTSDVPGHAMKVTDHAKAQGAVIGKAMTPLSEGTGLVLVLVSLQ